MEENTALAPSRDGHHVDLGMLRLCGTDLAVPVDWVREVVPCPTALGPCFGDHPALVGSIGVRGDVIPVVDVSAMLGLSERPERSDTIVVLRRDDTLLGLRVDSVSGLQRVAQSSLRALVSAGGGVRLISHAFVRDSHMIGILDPASLFELSGLSLVRGGGRAGNGAALARSRAFVLVSVAGVRVAIDSGLVESTAPASSLRKCEVPAPGWTRTVNYLGRDVRVFDQLSTLGLEGATKAESDGPVVLLRITPDRFVGWHVDAVRSVSRFPVDRLGPLPMWLAERGGFFSGIASDASDGQNLVLDSDKVRADPAIVAMADLCRPSPQGADARGSLVRAAGDGSAFLVFDTGGKLLAAPLDAIREVVPFAGLSSRITDSEGLRGIADHRGAPVSVYATDHGAGDSAKLLIIARETSGQGARGFLAERLATIVTTESQPIPGAVDDARFIPAVLGGKAHSVPIHPFG